MDADYTPLFSERTLTFEMNLPSSAIGDICLNFLATIINFNTIEKRQLVTWLDG
jgi:hypothetical protein